MNITKKWMPVLVIAVMLVLPLMASAQGGVVVPTNPPSTGQSSQGIVTIITRVANFLLAISAAIALIFVVVAGLMYVFSGGDSTKAEKARSMIWNGLIGLVIILAAYIIVNTVVKLAFEWLGGGSGGFNF